ncbi:nuclear receptor-binding factor 2-like [Ptychodera flava]|uniref:nuclear receptor-binding factor 2-like n=1 Tax=Ptychodera flava TaxID=63121 RepID=UPI003969D07F
MAAEAPLNLAHQQDRKAERFLNVGKFQDAILCHQKAAEYILNAMEKTTVQQALASLQLQYENHQKQQKVILEKERRYQLTKKIQAIKLEEAKSSLAGNRKPVESDSDNVDGKMDQSEITLENLSNGSDPIVKYSSRMRETDSLLRFLNGRSSHLDPQLEESTAFILAASTRELQSPLANAEYASRKSLQRLDQSESSEDEVGCDVSSAMTNGTKVPKDDGEVIEELRLENEYLKSHIVKLQRAWESCEKENQEMRETIHDLRRQLEEIKSSGQTTNHTDIISELNTPFSIPVAGIVDTPPLAELPPLAPLELPEFTFDLGKVGFSPPQE